MLLIGTLNGDTFFTFHKKRKRRLGKAQRAQIIIIRRLNVGHAALCPTYTVIPLLDPWLDVWI